MELGQFTQGSTAQTLVTLAIGGMFYLLPSMVAWYRSHHKASTVAIVNVFLGWTILGWFIALVWAFMRRSNPMAGY